MKKHRRYGARASRPRDPDIAPNQEAGHWRRSMAAWIESERLKAEGMTAAQRRAVLCERYPELPL